MEKQFEGKNIQQAVKNACEKLKISEEGLKYEIISHGSSGIFGIVGKKKAKISVTVNEELKAHDESEQTELIDQNEDPIVQVRGSIVSVNVPIKSEALIEEVIEGSKSTEKECTDFREDEAPGNMEDYVLRGEHAIRKIVDSITDEAEIRVEIKKNKIYYDIDCKESGSLIGKKGHTLDAIQYIIERIVGGRDNQKRIVQVDVCGYRSKRRALMSKLAVNVAKKVERLGKPLPIGLLNPQERKVVQLALKNQNVRCVTSKGEGYLKKIVIFPKGQDIAKPKLN
jgi:spoIIIJ-associated protein